MKILKSIVNFEEFQKLFKKEENDSLGYSEYYKFFILLENLKLITKDALSTEGAKEIFKQYTNTHKFISRPEMERMVSEIIESDVNHLNRHYIWMPYMNSKQLIKDIISSDKLFVLSGIELCVAFEDQNFYCIPK